MLLQLNPRLQRVLKAVITQTGYHRYQMNTKRLNTMMDEDTDSYLVRAPQLHTVSCI